MIFIKNNRTHFFCRYLFRYSEFRLVNFTSIKNFLIKKLYWKISCFGHEVSKVSALGTELSLSKLNRCILLTRWNSSETRFWWLSVENSIKKLDFLSDREIVRSWLNIEAMPCKANSGLASFWFTPWLVMLVAFSSVRFSQKLTRNIFKNFKKIEIV